MLALEVRIEEKSMLFQRNRKEANNYLGGSLCHLIENILITHSNPDKLVHAQYLMEMDVFPIEMR
jgi:hypothetical protein